VPGGLGADHFIKLVRGRIADVERGARNAVFGRLIGFFSSVLWPLAAGRAFAAALGCARAIAEKRANSS